MIHILKSKKNKMICNQVINHINYDINTTKTNYTKPHECKIPKGMKKKKKKKMYIKDCKVEKRSVEIMNLITKRKKKKVK